MHKDVHLHPYPPAAIAPNLIIKEYPIKLCCPTSITTDYPNPRIIDVIVREDVTYIVVQHEHRKPLVGSDVNCIYVQAVPLNTPQRVQEMHHYIGRVTTSHGELYIYGKDWRERAGTPALNSGVAQENA